MSPQRTCFAACRAFALAFVLALVPALAAAQQPTGRIAGTLRGSDGQPLVAADIVVVGTQLRAATGADGAFAIENVPAGRRQLLVTHLSYRESMVSDVLVQSGATAQVELSMRGALFRLDDVVVSASRQAQRITDAPATITRVDASAIENTVGNSFSGALKQVKGLDFIQVGVTSAAVNARGFNSSFNNRMLMMEDGRIAVLPENGLPVGSFTAIPKIDLASIEVLVGPGAALYGADASNGVITLLTKDPRAYKGTTIEVAGGNRSYMDIQGRHAGLAGNFGYKITGEHQQANDFSNVVRYRTNTLTETGVGNHVNWDSRVTRGTGSLYYYLPNSQLELSGGFSLSDGVGQTNVGRNQLDNWQYNFVQAKWSHPRLYVNAYRTQSKAGDSYALNRFTENKADNPGRTDEELRLMSDWPSDGQLYAAELQHNFSLPALNTRVVWGAQFRHDRVSSSREWLTDRLTGEDLTINQRGAYAQLEADILPQLQLVAAARVDDHDNYDTQFSPKAGIIFKPAQHQAFRATYNRAFKSPTTLQTNFFIPDFVRFVGVFGNRDGFTVKNAAGVQTDVYRPLVPEENQTVEVGYRGVIGSRVFIDVAAYRSEYRDFLSPLTTIANPYAAGGAARFAYDHNDQLITGPSGNQIVLTYFNLGKATVNGSDIGIRVLTTPKVELSGTFSWTDLADVEAPNTNAAREATALNAPEVKWTLGATAREVVPRLTAGFVMRHVTGYQFRSGINVGKIPTFETLDLDASVRLPMQGARLNVNVSNLFTCRTNYITPQGGTTGLRGRFCGVDETHQEMINMPSIGTLVFVGIRYTR